MRRGELDILADILEAAEVGAKKTHLVYRANLNNKVLKRYLRKLFEYGFIHIEGRFYVTTMKGVEFLYNYRQLLVPLRKIDLHAR